jgi:hypothetical protein
VWLHAAIVNLITGAKVHLVNDMPNLGPGPNGTTEFSDQQNYIDPTFEACLNAHGMYETMRFVLRLSPVNHGLLEDVDAGVYSVHELSPEKIRAFSTYIHETVHWWQHVGSTAGLVFSLSYPSQSHANFDHLKSVVEKFGPRKSIKSWADSVLLREGSAAQAKLAEANAVVNNALDIEYYKAFAFSPVDFVKWGPQQVHFESVGHSYYIAYALFHGLISSVVGDEHRYAPGERWSQEFESLRERQAMGFFHGSAIAIAQIGLRAIFEGQARFIQLQYLNGSRRYSFTMDELLKDGWLEGIYGDAFRYFLKLSELAQPVNFEDPTINLFLLVCDLALNPTCGFPLEIQDFESFIQEVDPGQRFALLSKAVREMPDLSRAIQLRTRDEYITAAEQLTEKCGFDHPLAALEEIKTWLQRSEQLRALMKEHETFGFQPDPAP